MEGGGLEMMGREMAQTKAETNPRGFMAEKKAAANQLFAASLAHGETKVGWETFP